MVVQTLKDGAESADFAGILPRDPFENVDGDEDEDFLDDEFADDDDFEEGDDDFLEEDDDEVEGTEEFDDDDEDDL